MKALLLLPFSTLLFSCAGPGQQAREDFFADMWFMPLSSFKQFVSKADFDSGITQDSFDRICAPRGAKLPVDAIEKIKLLAAHVSDKSVGNCFSRIITAQSAPFGTMQADEYNQLVGALLAQVRKRNIQIQERYTLNSDLDGENLKGLFEHQFGLFYHLGHGAFLSYRGEKLADWILGEVEARGMNFTRVGPFYEDDRVDRYHPELTEIVSRYEGLKPFLDSACSLSGKEREKGCARMKVRFKSLNKLGEIVRKGSRHLKEKHAAYESYRSAKGNPSRSVASESTEPTEPTE